MRKQEVAWKIHVTHKDKVRTVLIAQGVNHWKPHNQDIDEWEKVKYAIEQE